MSFLLGITGYKCEFRRELFNSKAVHNFLKYQRSGMVETIAELEDFIWQLKI